jgi:starvation-inducible DNA-binding protein
MSQLPEQMKQLWADNFCARIKAHGYHINLTGEDFFQYHKLFDEVYSSLDEYIDTIGEGIRTLDEVVPASLKRLNQLCTIPDATQVPDECDMVKELYADIESLIETASKAYDTCSTDRKYGLQNILADYLQDMEKLCWMLRASMEDPRVEAAEMAADKKLGIPEEPTPEI